MLLKNKSFIVIHILSTFYPHSKIKMWITVLNLLDKIKGLYHNPCMSFILSIMFLFSSVSVSSTPVEVIASSCFLYQAPSFESEKVQVDENDLVFHFGQNLTLLTEENNFALVQTTEGQTGYVYKYYIAKSEDFEVYPSFNGSIRTENAVIYNLDFEETNFRAKSGQGVYLYQGFSSEKFTAVQIVLENGKLYNGYVLTADLEPNGISSTLIVGITIISAVVTIVLSLLFIRKKKKKSGRNDWI